MAADSDIVSKKLNKSQRNKYRKLVTLTQEHCRIDNVFQLLAYGDHEAFIRYLPRAINKATGHEYSHTVPKIFNAKKKGIDVSEYYTPTPSCFTQCFSA